MKKDRKHILIVDDDPGITEVIKIILEENGFRVSIGNGNREMNKFIAEDYPNLLLLDILMYGKTGPEIVKLLKTKKETKNIPIIMMSASENTKKIARNVGADGFLEKPFNIDYLVEVVKKYLN